MANHKSAEKAHKRSLAKAARNKSLKTRIKTFINHFKKTIDEKNLDGARLAFRNIESKLMSSVSQGVLKLNTAKRKVSRLHHALKKFEAELTA